MYRSMPLALCLAMIPGCGVLLILPWLNANGPFGKETGSSELKAFDSEEELIEYFSDQIDARNDRFMEISLVQGRGDESAEFLDAEGAPDSPAVTDTDQTGPTDSGDGGATDDGDFSQTTIQEEGVDEADVVKTDGEYLYIISNASGSGVLRVVRASPPEQLTATSEIPLEGVGRNIYLHDGKVVALTETYGTFVYNGGTGIAIEPLPGPDVAVSSDALVETDTVIADVEAGVTDAGFEDVFDDVEYQRPRTIVTIVDVSTSENPAILSRTEFDGSPSASRMIDEVLHLVISNLQDYFYDVLPMLGQPELDLRTVDTTELLPRFTRVDADGTERVESMVTWRDLYRPTDPDGFGLVTVVSLDVDNDAEFTAVGVVAQPGLVYSSLDALYLTDTEYDFFGDTRETTDIYKFAYEDRGAQPRATGSVPGRILNQYSMSEYDGYLRVATTVGRREPDNNLYVLAQSGITLEVVGSVEHIAPRETIKSARFVGDRGYVVTFEEMDPLFTLDLSDPTDPKVVGELEIPGFSTFIVPIDADHLLAVGQYIPDGELFFGWGVQLSIFDVTDFRNPQRTQNVVLGQEGGASSEALYNPKALTYFAERGLLALPVSIGEGLWFVDVGVSEIDDSAGVDAVAGDSGSSSTVDAEPSPPTEDVDGLVSPDEPLIPQGFEGLFVYSVSVEDGLTELGRISTRFDETGHYWSSFTRGVFIGDDVFAVTDHGVRAAPLSDLAGVTNELAFESAADAGGVDEAPPPTDDGAVAGKPADDN